MSRRFGLSSGLPPGTEMKYEMSKTTKEKRIKPSQVGKRGRHRELESYLIKCANRGDKNDCVGIIEIRHPRVSLATSTTHVEEMPSNGLAMDIHVEYMLRDTHCLDSSV